LKPLTRKTCEDAWLAAAQFLRTEVEHREAHNLIVEIEAPAAHSSGDLRLRSEVDQFLRSHDANPIFTVAETIFPAALYRDEGVKGVYETYPNIVYDAIKQPGEWGRYAQRLLRRKGPDGKVFNPLERTVERLKAAATGHDPKRACFELSLAEDALDLPIALPIDKRTRGGPCLSHISLKAGRDKRLYLTAIYRYHYFIERALGNYLGLAALQAFLCEQAGLDIGPIVCVSTYCKLDTEGGWTKTSVNALLDRCKLALANTAGS
jgi:hypothetical protein